MHAYNEDDNRLGKGVQPFFLLVPLVANLLLESLPLLDKGGDGTAKGRHGRSKSKYAIVTNIAAPNEHLIIYA